MFWRLVLLRYCIVFVMLNLFNVNVDSGFMYFIGLGYYKDFQIRVIFMEVLIKIF